MDIKNLTTRQILRLKSRLNMEINRLGKDYTVTRDKWISDGANGFMPSGDDEQVTFKALLGNLTTSQIKAITTDGGRQYNITHYVIITYDDKLILRQGDTFSNDNMLYEVVEVFDVADMGLYWYVSLQATMKESEKYGK